MSLRAIVLCALCLWSWSMAGATISADEGWIIDRMNIQIDVQPDGTLYVQESLDVDFRNLEKHGIFRDIRRTDIFDEEHLRDYDITLVSVTDDRGVPLHSQREEEGALVRFRIGDPDRTITGRAGYRIVYRVKDALNGFADHDELYWNITGTWPVEIANAVVTVTVPRGLEKATCFQGGSGSTEPCRSSLDGNKATFATTRGLPEGEQLTIVSAVDKGVFPEPRPVLRRMPRGLEEFFETGASFLTGTAVLSALVVGGLGMLGWRGGRDRRFVSVHYLTGTEQEETLPPFASDPVVVEFQPPEKLRPAQIGLLIDERADTRDITATIVDLAVRGYITITELPKEGWLSSKDWRFEKGNKNPGEELLEYETLVLHGLVGQGSTKLSDLKEKFYKTLDKSKKALYKDAMERRWFVRNPDSVRALYVISGALVFVAGVIAVVFGGAGYGAGLVAMPIPVGGIMLMVLSRWMPKRTAMGRELMRRSIGFAQYIKTAEVQQQEYNERANIFSDYLPFAIAFKCVDRWAKAFEGLAIPPQSMTWYHGTATTFDASHFTSNINSFTSSVSSTIASTPGGSGGSGSSGFSGGSSGGGGGGGGGGSW